MNLCNRRHLSVDRRRGSLRHGRLDRSRGSDGHCSKCRKRRMRRQRRGVRSVQPSLARSAKSRTRHSPRVDPFILLFLLIPLLLLSPTSVQTPVRHSRRGGGSHVDLLAQDKRPNPGRRSVNRLPRGRDRVPVPIIISVLPLLLLPPHPVNRPLPLRLRYARRRGEGDGGVRREVLGWESGRTVSRSSVLRLRRGGRLSRRGSRTRSKPIP